MQVLHPVDKTKDKKTIKEETTDQGNHTFPSPFFHFFLSTHSRFFLTPLPLLLLFWTNPLYFANLIKPKITALFSLLLVHLRDPPSLKKRPSFSLP